MEALPDIPGETLRLYELRIVQYLDNEGQESVHYVWVNGDSPAISQAVGIVEITKLMMIEKTDMENE